MFSPRFLPQIDKYFARSHLVVALLCAFGLMAIIVVGDVFQKMDEFTSYAERSKQGFAVVLWLLARYYAVLAPGLLLQWMLPLVLLMSGVIVVTVASSSNEYTALRAAGISMQRAVLPLLAVSLLIGYAVSFSRDWVLPHLLRKSSEINTMIRPRTTKPVQLPIRDGSEMHFIAMGYYDPKAGAAYNIRIDVRDTKAFYEGQETFTSYSAAKAYLQPRTNVDGSGDERQLQWMPDRPGAKLTQGTFMRKIDDWTEPLPTYITPAMLERQALGEAVMTWGDLSRLSDDLDIQTEKQSRRSEPWVGAVLMLVGLSFVLRRNVMGQESNYVKNMVTAIMVAAVFYVTRLAFLSFGESEYIGPFLAAWMPNLLFGATGLWHFLRLER